MASVARRKIYRFAHFEVYPEAGEVRKYGVRIKVQEQPFKLLEALLERPGTLITRDELHARLWPNDTFGNFDHGLNAAAARLRQALGDSARPPRFVEGVPRRGYRFIAPVETLPAESGQPVSEAPLQAEQEPLTASEDNGHNQSTQFVASAPETQAGYGRRLSWIAGVVLIVLATVVGWLQLRDRPGGVSSVKFSLTPPEGTKFVDFDPVTLSPDGRFMAFTATDSSGETELWIRPLDDVGGRRLEGTKGASFPFWSPDSRSIAFFANGRLNRLEIPGGLPKIVCNAADGRGGSWNADGSIVFAPSLKSPLFQVPATGGEPKQLTTLDRSRQEISHRWPSFLPDGQHFVYVIRSTKAEDSGVYVGSMKGLRGSLLVRTMSNAVYASDKSGGGYLLFAHDAKVVARRFDSRRLAITGPEFPIAESPTRAIMEPLRAAFSVSDTGILAYQRGRGADQLTWFDRNGVQLKPLGEPGVHLDISLSPTGKELAFSRLEPHTGRYDVWRIDLASGAASRVTYGARDQFSPIWSPDGSRMVYGSKKLEYSQQDPDLTGRIYETSSDGGDESKLLLESDYIKVPWSTNGNFVLYHEIRPGKKIDTWVLPLQGGGEPIALLHGRSNQLFAVFSPDGKWVAYASDESGKQEVYVSPFAPGAETVSKWVVSNAGGSQPEWPGDGKQLYYLAPDKRIMAVPVTIVNGRFSSGAPRMLFRSDIIDDFRARFGVTSDGQQFLIPSAAGQAGSPTTIVVVNWMPVKKH